MRRRRIALGAAWVLATSMAFPGAGLAHPGQHGTPEGHLLGTGDEGKIEYVGEFRVADAEEGLIADVAVDPSGDYAYLARWGGEACAGPEGDGPDGGVYIVDISDPEDPTQVGFIRTHQDTLVGEGMQVIHLETAYFTGEVLVLNHEGCGKNFKGGTSLWDVTNPLEPKKLRENFGDFTIDGGRARPHDANQTHSAFAWQAGDRAYLVSVDDMEASDVDIFDITNPKKPVLIGEFNLNEFDVSQPELGLVDSFLHDVVVKKIGEQYIMLLSYWDGGYVLLDVTNPADPDFLDDTEFAAIDPELFEQTGAELTPEGNAHQAEFTIDNRFIIATDEDFDPYRLEVTFEDGSFLAKAGTNTEIADAEAITGTTVFVGLACPGGAAVPPAPNLPGDEIAVVERGVCFFTEKVAAVLAAGGYEAVIIMNREGEDACTGVFTPDVDGDIPTIFMGRDAGFALFDTTFNLAACLDDTPQVAPIAVGTVGDTIGGIDSVFDGWGYVHLFDAATLEELDTFAIPEAMDEAFADGFGDLSVHEVAVDPQDASLAYLSYYAGGLVALQIQCSNPADTATCELVEVGSYLDPDGNNFWGVETFIGDDGMTWILASDRDSGLFIFRDP